MTIATGRISQGCIVLDHRLTLPEGTRVQVAVGVIKKKRANRSTKSGRVRPVAEELQFVRKSRPGLAKIMRAEGV